MISQLGNIAGIEGANNALNFAINMKKAQV